MYAIHTVKCTDINDDDDDDDRSGYSSGGGDGVDYDGRVGVENGVEKRP